METQETLEFREIIQYRRFVNEKSAMVRQFNPANTPSAAARGVFPFEERGVFRMAFSNVYFCNLRTSMKENLPTKLKRLIETAGLKEIVSVRNLVAIKLHFGEKGNAAFIRPILVRPIVDAVKELGGAPFLTDANTLYAGTRGNSISHLITAMENGFAYSVVNAPLIIADGLRGASFSKIRIEKEVIKTAYIGKEIVEADVLISVAHFKGHELSGFGGTIKNMGMGCAARKGKLEQHSDLSPKVKPKKCVGCGECVEDRKSVV